MHICNTTHWSYEATAELGSACNLMFSRAFKRVTRHFRSIARQILLHRQVNIRQRRRLLHVHRFTSLL